MSQFLQFILLAGAAGACTFLATVALLTAVSTPSRNYGHFGTPERDDDH